jgi:5,6-dimethylbenzimidazole synthase
MIAGAVAPASTVPPVFSTAFRQELDALFRWRRDVRRFRRDPVPEASVDAVMRSAAHAPSVGLSEPWRFVRVGSEAGRAAALSNFEDCNADALAAQPEERRALYARLKLAGLREAPVHIAVFCDEAGMQGQGLGCATMPEMRRYSVVCAVMQMWLAARALGLGMGWVSIIDPARLAEDLDIPRDWSLIAYLCLGWPEEDHADPELQRAGWEDRHDLAARLLHR